VLLKRWSDDWRVIEEMVRWLVCYWRDVPMIVWQFWLTTSRKLWTSNLSSSDSCDWLLCVEKVVGGEDAVGELEITPVSAAIARHLNIDLSQEGHAARNRRGIALIVHGAPMSGNWASLCWCFSIEVLLINLSVEYELPFWSTATAKWIDVTTQG